MKKCRIGINTAVYGRKKIFLIWAKNIQEHFPNALVSVGYSEPFYKDIIEGHGFEAVPKQNFPLADKFDAALENMKDRCEYVLFLGSDDIVNTELAEFYYQFDGDFLAFEDMYFIDHETKEEKYWSGYTNYRKGEPAGAGKLLSSRILDDLEWKVFHGAGNNQLDSVFHQKMVKRQNIGMLEMTIMNLKENGFRIFDIKTDDNMTSFEDLNI